MIRALPAPSKGRILVVEDDEPIRLMISKILARQGFETKGAEDGQRAVDLIADTSYDAIILDFMMPRMNGLQVLEWMARERPGSAKSCVIVLTAVAPRIIEASIDNGQVFAILRKPFEVPELLTTIEQCLSRRRGQDL